VLVQAGFTEDKIEAFISEGVVIAAAVTDDDGIADG
jgi:hypothetical protein